MSKACVFEELQILVDLFPGFALTWMEEYDTNLEHVHWWDNPGSSQTMSYQNQPFH